MLPITVKEKTSRMPVLLFFALMVCSFAAKAGGDTYHIYLNDKLLLKQMVVQPITLQQLQLSKKNINDQLVIYYDHCGKTGTDRSIAVKTSKGVTIKEWKFANTNPADKGMAIKVGELLQLQANHNSGLALHYSSAELPKGLSLAALSETSGNTTFSKNLKTTDEDMVYRYPLLAPLFLLIPLLRFI